MALVRSASGRMPSEADFEAVMESLREKLKKRGAQGIRGLARNFKICDRDGSRSLDVQELAKCCSSKPHHHMQKAALWVSTR